MKSVKGRILIVSSSLDMGGAQKMISNITTTLPKTWIVDIVLNTDKNIQFPYRGNIISLNVKEPKSRTSLIYQSNVFLKRIRILGYLKRKNHYKACISLLDSANIANIITGNRYCKVIITAIVNMSESRHIKAYKYIVFPLIRLFYNFADGIIAQNAAIKDDLIRNFGLKKDLFTIIYNGIDVEAIKKICRNSIQKEDEKWFSKEYTIVTAGRFTYAKGQWHIIRAFTRVLKKIPEAKLVIFGVGELENYLKRLVNDYEIEKSVYIKGFDSELDKYIFNSAVFVLPSMIEGMPTVLLEALACGVPSVVTDFKSGAREIMDYPMNSQIDDIVEAEYGIITPICSGEYHEATEELENNEKLLADALIQLLRDKNLREKYAKHSEKRSYEFDMKNLITQWLKVINN